MIQDKPSDATMKLPTNQRPTRTATGGPQWSPPTLEEMQRMLPDYAFIGMLGAGGMGAVFKARQTSLDRFVAIKILPPDLDDGRGGNFAERFRQEARTMAKMSHPFIVDVHKFGQTADGQFYFVMEFVEGTDVQKMIRANKKLPPDEALKIAENVCDALEYAHAHGVLHRDIKPANVLIGAGGVVKIADFGIAKIVDDASHEMTRSNVAMGTPHFMAPEAMDVDVKLDGRADLYAVGVMLHNMLTGEIPSGMFKLPSEKTGCDPRFDAIVKKAMESDREERFQTATEIRQALHAIRTTPIEMNAKADGGDKTASRRGWIVAMSVAGAAVVVGLFAWSPWKKSGADISSGAPRGLGAGVVASPPVLKRGDWQAVDMEPVRQTGVVTAQTGGWWHIDHKYFDVPSGTNIAVRARARLYGDLTWPFLMRDSNTVALVHYAVSLDRLSGQLTLHRRVMSGGSYTPDDKPLAAALLPRKLAIGEEFDLGIAAQGDEITVTFDGAKLIATTDAFCKGQRNRFGSDLEFKNLEWRDLSAESKP